jgi:hypothetical protein
MMIILLLWLSAVGGITIGIKGFTKKGLPLIGSVYVTGRAARIIGGICLATGIASLLVFVFIWSAHSV